MRLARNAGRLGSAWWRRGPLITPDTNTVAHVIWRNSALVDRIGNSWTQVGTVPQNPGDRLPPSAGDFSAANHYTLGSGVDVLDFGGGTFTTVFVGRVTSLPAATMALLEDATPVATGYQIYFLNTGTLNITTYNGGVSTQVTSNSVSAGQLFVACAGISGSTTGMVKLNGGTYQSGAVNAMGSPAADLARLGYEATFTRPLLGRLYEFYATTTTPSDALFTTITSQVFQRLKRSP